MATWMAHFRIADYFVKQHGRLMIEPFLVGNIGPDCGVPNEDWSSFTPPKRISHWHNGKTEIDAENFRSTYLAGGNIKDAYEFAFFLGYYIHLLADKAWSRLARWKMTEPMYRDNLAKDPNFIWIAKEDWYGLDHLFLREHPDFIFYTHFAPVHEFPNRFFDFYPLDAFTRQIRYISDFYLNFNGNLDRPFLYLSRQEMDGFVEAAIREIEPKVREILQEYYLEKGEQAK